MWASHESRESLPVATMPSSKAAISCQQTSRFRCIRSRCLHASTASNCSLLKHTLQVNPDILSNYTVTLEPRCNPVSASFCSGSALPTQTIVVCSVTVPLQPPLLTSCLQTPYNATVLTDNFDFNITGFFSDFAYNNETKAFIQVLGRKCVRSWLTAARPRAGWKLQALTPHSNNFQLTSPHM